MILFYLIFILFFGENLSKHAVAKQYLDFVWHKLYYLRETYAFSNQPLLTPQIFCYFFKKFITEVA